MHYKTAIRDKPSFSDAIWQRPTFPGVRPWLPCGPGHSYRRGMLPLLAIPDAPPACFDPGTAIVAQALLCSSDLHLAASPTGRARFRSHRARQTPVPLGAAMAEPNQVRCMYVGWDDQAIKTMPIGYEKSPAKAVLHHVAPGRSQPRCMIRYNKLRKLKKT